MKANEAPEKLYVDTEDRLSDSILYGFTEKRKDDDIEYTRTDILEVKKVEPNTTELRPKKKTVRPARFDIVGRIIEKIKKARKHGNRKS